MCDLPLITAFTVRDIRSSGLIHLYVQLAEPRALLLRLSQHHVRPNACRACGQDILLRSGSRFHLPHLSREILSVDVLLYDRVADDHTVRVPLDTALLAVLNLEMCGMIVQDIEFRALKVSLSMMSKILNDVLDFASGAPAAVCSATPILEAPGKAKFVPGVSGQQCVVCGSSWMRSGGSSIKYEGARGLSYYNCI
ncbi:hypothetical protein A0H81_02773 [Grifola frondosa]|uniref:Uncharacterized protein n=1 Tax=Grifola frondosa TaxID=5627 RepID=A0A1C7MMP7_GRIFR|nr:hypothetical protein A0H81_02773 [Grifola frondosa]